MLKLSFIIFPDMYLYWIIIDSTCSTAMGKINFCWKYYTRSRKGTSRSGQTSPEISFLGSHEDSIFYSTVQYSQISLSESNTVLPPEVIGQCQHTKGMIRTNTVLLGPVSRSWVQYWPWRF